MLRWGCARVFSPTPVNLMLLLIFTAVVVHTTALPNGAALTPPRGITTWEIFNFAVSAAELEALAEGAVSTGLAAAGYSIIWLDDGWPLCAKFSGAPGTSACATPAPRAANGSVVVDDAKFPQGMAAVVASIHARGLQVGIYTAPHAVTCGGYTASLNYEAVDAATFVAWGIDAV